MPIDLRLSLRNRSHKEKKNRISFLPCFTSIDSKRARHIYRKFQVLHVRQGKAERCLSASDLIELNTSHFDVIKSTWSIENDGGTEKSYLDPLNVLGSNTSPGIIKRKDDETSWYASFIFQAETTTSGNNIVDDFLDKLPISNPSFMPHCEYEKQSKSMWIFFGRHQRQLSKQLTEAATHVVAGGHPSRGSKEVHGGLCGRKEHTDSVEYTGTWHYQVSG